MPTVSWFLGYLSFEKVLRSVKAKADSGTILLWAKGHPWVLVDPASPAALCFPLFRAQQALS